MKPKKTSVQHHATFGEGGGGHMLPKQAANPQKPGGTAHCRQGQSSWSQTCIRRSSDPRCLGFKASSTGPHCSCNEGALTDG